MAAQKNVTSWDIVKGPNQILLEEDYSGKMELLIYTLIWGVEIGLAFMLALTYLKG